MTYNKLMKMCMILCTVCETHHNYVGGMLKMTQVLAMVLRFKQNIEQDAVK